MVKDAQLGTERRSVVSEDAGLACSAFLSWGPGVIIQERQGGGAMEPRGHQRKEGGVNSTFDSTRMAQKGGGQRTMGSYGHKPVLFFSQRMGSTLDSARPL